MPNYRFPFDVRDFGARGQGDTIDIDDTHAINLALAEADGKPVYFPAGVYLITDELLLNFDYVTIFGDAGLTVIKQTVVGAGCFANQSSSRHFSITMRDITIGLDGDIQGGTAVDLTGCSDAFLSNVRVIADNSSQGYLTAFRCHTPTGSLGSFRNEFYGCTARTYPSVDARGLLLDAVSGQQSNSHRWIGGSIRADSGKGVYCPKNGAAVSDHNIVAYATFEGTTAQAVEMDGRWHKVDACRFEGVTNGILWGSSSQYCVSEDNMFTSGLSTQVVNNGTNNERRGPQQS